MKKRKISESHIGLRLSEDTKIKLAKINEKYTYELISPCNKTYTITNLKAFCKQKGLLQPCIQRLVTGQIKKNEYKGWKGKILTIKEEP